MLKDPFAARLSRFRKLLAEGDIDTFLVAVPENRYYLSGFEAEDLMPTESSGYLLITGSRQHLLTDFRYEEEARQEAPGFELIIYRDGLAASLPELFSTLSTEKLGVEAHYLTVTTFREIEAALRQARPNAVMEPVENLVEGMRIIKDADEIKLIKESVRHSERVIEAVWNGLQVGKTEKEVAWEIERRIRENGAESVSFPPIAASGPNAALPHAVPSSKRISAGESVILDMGSRLHLYCSDMTRTWVGGTPDGKLKEIYRIVREAQLAAQDAIRAGMESSAVDRVARDIIEQAGYGDNFGHGLGHGVGLAVHEPPRLSKRKPTVLEPGMVVTIEPGIYLPGFGGVRLENMVVVTENGCELFNEIDLMYDWS